MRKLAECVPNFSVGRDPAKIEEIKKAVLSVDGVDLLDCSEPYRVSYLSFKSGKIHSFYELRRYEIPRL